MFDSKSEFISTEDGLDVYVEHADFGNEAMHFINGIASDMWHGEVDHEADDYRKKMNPTLRYWKSRKRPERPNLHITKRRMRFVPPLSQCLLGPEPQYEMEGVGRCAREVVKRHPACACDRCTHYHYYHGATDSSRASENFWEKITGRIQVEV